MHNTAPQRGFTLLELVMVIVLIGIIGGMVAVFMKTPIDAYIASARRAALTDEADTVVRRMARDLQRALPNSINTSVDQKCIEFIPTKTGARYRSADAGSLNFGVAVTTFNMLGNNANLPPSQQIVPGDIIAISNMGYEVGNAYTGATPPGANTALVNGIASGTETVITIPSTTFDAALASPNSRFQVIPKDEQVVAYVCSGTKVYRMAQNSRAHICTGTVTPSGPILAKDVSACSFNYNSSIDLLRNALVSMILAFTDGGETVTLQHEVHVSNTP